jgi:predicted nucleotidyltransferase/GNAT superfamily N-acetyltransferase
MKKVITLLIILSFSMESIGIDSTLSVVRQAGVVSEDTLRPVAAALSGKVEVAESGIIKESTSAVSNSPANNNLPALEAYLSKIKYKDAIITEEDFNFSTGGITLTSYCDRQCSFCNLSNNSLLKEGQEKDSSKIISNDIIYRFLQVFSAERKFSGKWAWLKRLFASRTGDVDIVISGDGEPFLEFEKILHIVRNAKCGMLAIKTNGFWGKSKEDTARHLKQITEAADSNPGLRIIQLNLSADAYHKNISETVNILDVFLDAKDNGKAEIAGKKIHLAVTCHVDPDFEKYQNSLLDALGARKIELAGRPMSRGRETIFFLKLVRKKWAINWILGPPMPIGRAYSMWDEMKLAWEKLFDFTHAFRKKENIPYPIFGELPFRNPQIFDFEYKPTGLGPFVNIGCRYNGEIMLGCQPSPFLTLGNIYMDKSQWVVNANNNPFLRAIKEGRVCDILCFAGMIRPEVTHKIPFGVSDVEIMAWLLSIDSKLTGQILDFILEEDIKNGRLILDDPGYPKNSSAGKMPPNQTLAAFTAENSALKKYEALFTHLKDCLYKTYIMFPQMRAVYLYGSIANKAKWEPSDIDLRVLVPFFTSTATKYELAESLQDEWYKLDFKGRIPLHIMVDTPFESFFIFLAQLFCSIIFMQWKMFFYCTNRILLAKTIKTYPDISHANTIEKSETVPAVNQASPKSSSSGLVRDVQGSVKILHSHALTQAQLIALAEFLVRERIAISTKYVDDNKHAVEVGMAYIDRLKGENTPVNKGFFVAFNKTEPVGIVLYSIDQIYGGIMHAALEDLYVKPSNANNHIGTRLFEAVKDYTRSSGANDCTIIIANTKKAQDFWKNKILPEYQVIDEKGILWMATIPLNDQSSDSHPNVSLKSLTLSTRNKEFKTFIPKTSSSGQEGVEAKLKTFVVDAKTGKPVDAVVIIEKGTRDSKLVLEVSGKKEGSVIFEHIKHEGRTYIHGDNLQSEDNNQREAKSKRYSGVGLRLLQALVVHSKSDIEAKGAIILFTEEMNAPVQKFCETLISYGLDGKMEDDGVIWSLEPKYADSFISGIDKMMMEKTSSSGLVDSMIQEMENPVARSAAISGNAISTATPIHKLSHIAMTALESAA